MTEKYRHFFEIHTRSKEEGEEPNEEEVTIEGKAVTFNDETLLYRLEDGTPVYEMIMPEALDKTDMKDVVFDLNHDWDRSIPLARTRNNSLLLEKREDGLWFTAKIRKDNEEGMKVYRAIEQGLLDRCSFAFTLALDGEDIESRTEEDGSEAYHIVVKDIDRLYDVSAVSIPAYDNTSLSARSRYAKDVETFKASVETDKVTALRKKIMSKQF